MEHFDKETLTRLIETLVIVAVAAGLFLGLRSGLGRLAQRVNLPRLAFAPVRTGLRYAILVIAGFLVLGRWGFHVNTLLTVLGTALGLIAIGFVAMWSVLSNFLCTFVLVVFKPFSVGDEIEFPATGIKGQVVDLSLIFTTLQVSRNETVLIPNNTFFQGVFKRRPSSVAVGLDYQLQQEHPHPGTGL